MDLLGEVVLASHFIDQIELGFQPVDGVFFVFENTLEQLTRPVVGLVATQSDPPVQPSSAGLFLDSSALFYGIPLIGHCRKRS